MNLPMVDLVGQTSHIRSEIDTAVAHVLSSAQFINGPEVHAFARELETYLKCTHVVPCANGTDALQIAMMALELQPGDEVIVPVHTYVATAEVIALLKLTPVFIDVDYDLFTLDVTQLEDKITNKTKLIVPVHLYGQCANMEEINRIAKKYSVAVVEDNAQAIGAIYTFSDGNQQSSGCIGDIGTTSFFPSKNLGCFGDGGAITTNNAELAAFAKQIANHGQTRKYVHDSIGCNSRLDSIQAAILRIKLKRLDHYNQARREAADRYDALLQNVDGVLIPQRAPYSTHVFHQYTIRLLEADRNLVQEKLQEQGIPSMIYYPIPLHYQKGYAVEGIKEGAFPVTEVLSKQVLSLPMHTELTESTQEYIIEGLKKALS